MYEIQCAMHPLYDCFVNVPFTSTICKFQVEKFQVEIFSGWGEIFSGGVEIFSGGVEIFFGGG